MVSKPYAFIDAPVPEGKARKGLYVEMLEDFTASGRKSVIVKMHDKGSKTVYDGLKTALRNNKPRFSDVRVVMRDGETYLVRE